jgi:low affinity Fe/Cu permease
MLLPRRPPYATGGAAERLGLTMSSPGPFVRFSHQVAHIAGRPVTFATACILILVWAVSGPVFHFSETWQLVVNTATTIITFLMVFVLQNTQNRDGEAVQAKLDELIYALQGADNHFVAAEKLSDKDLKALRDRLTVQCDTASAEIDRRSKSAAPRREPA